MARATAETRATGFHENLGMRLRGAYLSLHRMTGAHFRQFDMTSDQFVVLGLLEEEDGITQTELTRRSFSDPNTMAAMVRLLEKRGLVARKAHLTDGRAWCVELTASGRKMARRLRESMEGFEREFRATLPEGGEEVVMEWLGRVVEEMRR